MPKAFIRPPNANSTASAAISRRPVSRPMPERRRSSSSSAPGTPTAIATLSCGHACTQSRQKVQSRLPTLAGRNRPSSQPRCLVCGRPLMQSNVRQVAQVSGLPDLHLQRRHRRCDEVELANRTQVLAEGRAGKHHIDRERGAEVGEHQHRRASRQRPQIEQLVAEEHGDEQQDADPFGAQPARPAEPRLVDPASDVAHQHERAACAEQIAGRQQGDDQQSAIVHPGHDRREIGRCDLRTEESMSDDHRRDQQGHELQRRARMTPAEEGPDDGPPQDVNLTGRHGDTGIDSMVEAASIWQRAGHEQNPAAGHRELQADLVDAGSRSTAVAITGAIPGCAICPSRRSRAP